LSINFAALKKLGKQIIMFLAGTLGIIIGGPFALYIVGSYPEVALSNGEEVWKGLSTLREVDWWWCKSNRHARSIWQAKACLLR
jgi:hypothetical protein